MRIFPFKARVSLIQELPPQNRSPKEDIPKIEYPSCSKTLLPRETIPLLILIIVQHEDIRDTEETSFLRSLPPALPRCPITLRRTHDTTLPLVIPLLLGKMMIRAAMEKEEAP
jgi:hypothetical protein